jgi:hypothetical protein
VPGGEPAATVVESFGIDGAAAAVEVDGRVAVEGRDAWVIALGWPGTDPWPAGMHRSSRETPLDLAAPFRRSVRCVVALPSGWEPAILPRAVRVDAAAGRFVQEVVVGGGEVRITRTLEIDAPRVEPAAYDGLRRIYLESVSAGAEPLVLRRTPSPP